MAAEATKERSRGERRVRQREFVRSAILTAARQVAARDGAAELSLRAVAAEAGFAPAALYGYFANKRELLIALAAEDLSTLARVLREAKAGGGFRAAAGAALDLLQQAETFAAGSAALPEKGGAGETERLFNGRLIAVLRALSEASGGVADTRDAQEDVVLLAATLAGLAVFARSGRLKALGFAPAEMIAALDRRFAARQE